MNRDCSVCKATDSRLYDQRSILCRETNFSIRHHVHTPSGSQPVPYPLDVEDSSPGGDHSFQSSVVNENVMLWCL
jgi:hypothetical protein